MDFVGCHLLVYHPSVRQNHTCATGLGLQLAHLEDLGHWTISLCLGAIYTAFVKQLSKRNWQRCTMLWFGPRNAVWKVDCGLIVRESPKEWDISCVEDGFTPNQSHSCGRRFLWLGGANLEGCLTLSGEWLTGTINWLIRLLLQTMRGAILPFGKHGRAQP